MSAPSAAAQTFRQPVPGGAQADINHHDPVPDLHTNRALQSCPPVAAGRAWHGLRDAARPETLAMIGRMRLNRSEATA